MLSKSDILIFIGVAVSFCLGVYLFFTGNFRQAVFAATWVPTLLCFGIYFKLLVTRNVS